MCAGLEPTPTGWLIVGRAKKWAIGGLCNAAISKVDNTKTGGGYCPTPPFNVEVATPKAVNNTGSGCASMQCTVQGRRRTLSTPRGNPCATPLNNWKF